MEATGGQISHSIKIENLPFKFMGQSPVNVNKSPDLRKDLC